MDGAAEGGGKLESAGVFYGYMLGEKPGLVTLGTDPEDPRYSIWGEIVCFVHAAWCCLSHTGVVPHPGYSSAPE